MGKKHQDTQSTSTYQYMQAPANANYDNAKALIEGYDGGAAGIREGHARNINQINEGGNDLFGAATSPEVRDRVKQARLFRNNMDLGRGLADAKQNEIGYKNSAYMSLGGATAPSLVQTGGTQNSQSYGGMGQMFLQSLGNSAGSALGA